jgi:hypothetical protein
LVRRWPRDVQAWVEYVWFSIRGPLARQEPRLGREYSLVIYTDTAMRGLRSLGRTAVAGSCEHLLRRWWCCNQTPS